MAPSKGRPPIENPKKIRLEIRLTEIESKDLQYCADFLKVSRTEVLNQGIQLVKAEISKK